ncbi:hypothetical protein HanPI659440_Chr17g0694931 [Helianthus annuus]|nr:hypothetical protein HanPI659440_Chr17g0694931 [Helianthus annuus]
MRPSVRFSAVAALFVTVLLFASPVFGSDYEHKVNFCFKPQPFDLRHGYSICYVFDLECDDLVV